MALFLLLSLGVTSLFFLGSTEIREWTTAICEGNVCRDYLVKCEGEKVIEMRPVTGFVVFPEDWEDTRIERKLC